MKKLLSDKNADTVVFGRNVKAFRTLRGWSIRELAASARLSTRTLVKIEQGKGCTLKTERKVAQGLNVYLGRLWDPSVLNEEPQRVISRNDGRWFFANLDDAARYHLRGRRTSPDEDEDRMRSDPDEIQDDAERLRLGRTGLSRAFVKVCGGGISAGFFQFNECEVFAHDVTPPNGSNYPYLLICKSGGLAFSIRGDTHVLNSGESIVFEGNAAFTLEPANAMAREELPCTFYYVCLRLLPTTNRKTLDSDTGLLESS